MSNIDFKYEHGGKSYLVEAIIEPGYIKNYSHDSDEAIDGAPPIVTSINIFHDNEQISLTEVVEEEICNHAIDLYLEKY